ncbi:MAG: type I-E CRISPR-associated endonuclease Cas1e [Planctomycetaceae bacterium]
MQLTRFQDRLSYLYLEKGHIEQEAKSIAYVTEKQRVPIPAADLALLMLGPGTTITHKAVCNLADCNCTVVWCGEEGVRFYCHGRGGTHFSANLLQQAALASNPRSRRAVVIRMYEKRFGETIDPDTHIQAVRGKEGYRVRSAYQKYAAEFGLTWSGRNFDPQSWNRGDPLNRALSAASACLNGIIHAGVVSAGYSTALGFVHTGKMLSFVYDVADLYKIDEIVPLVFRTVSESDQNVERRVRLACRDMFRRTRFLERLLPDIREVLYGRDDSGARAAEPAGGSESLDDRTEGRDLPWPHDRPYT